ncbi:MAG: hypothetical protein Ct9H300mP16_17710 [Pseudomonadota bacterium]|nr:MAG: hypothetical protein Ct9H300mP16_17710 [Pseudomonadota bacterium]
MHAFASDPARGLFILIFLALLRAVHCPVCLAGTCNPECGRPQWSPGRRTVAEQRAVGGHYRSGPLGTLYPLVLSTGSGKISVGPPYFNTVFVPLTLPLGVFMAIGALLRWKQDSFQRLWPQLRILLAASVVGGGIWPLAMSRYEIGAALAATLGIWVVLSACHSLWIRTATGRRWQGLRNTPSGLWGMALAHCGVGVFIIGVAFTSIYTVEKDLRMAPGDSLRARDTTIASKGSKTPPDPIMRARPGGSRSRGTGGRWRR